MERAGIAVELGERAAETSEIYEAFFKWVTTALPFLTLKYAMTADGKIAARTGASHWVTGPEARQYVASLRAGVDAVLVGIGTILSDDPQLTARPEGPDWEAGRPVHQPLRVILDSQARLPLSAAVVAGQLPGRTLLCATAQAPADGVAELEGRGVEVLFLPERDGKVDIIELMKLLGQRGVTSILAEPGGTLAAALLEAGAVDKVLAFIAPKIVGGDAAPSPVGGTGRDSMAAALPLHDSQWRVVGEDMLLKGYLTGGEG